MDALPLPRGVRLGTTLECFATLAIASLPLSLVLLVMLRHAVRLHPTMVAMMGGLASSGGLRRGAEG